MNDKNKIIIFSVSIEFFIELNLFHLEKFLSNYSLNSLLLRYFKRLFYFSHKIFTHKIPVVLFNYFEFSKFISICL